MAPDKATMTIKEIDGSRYKYWQWRDCESGRILSEYIGPVEEERVCVVCGLEGNQKNIHNHHVSYENEDVVHACSSCHPKIHSKDGFHDDLKPDISREEAKDRGLIGNSYYGDENSG